MDTRDEHAILTALVDHEMTLVELVDATNLRFLRLVPALDNLVRLGRVTSHRDRSSSTLYAVTDTP